MIDEADAGAIAENETEGDEEEGEEADGSLGWHEGSFTGAIRQCQLGLRGRRGIWEK